jgi:hypothetical protein
MNAIVSHLLNIKETDPNLGDFTTQVQSLCGELPKDKNGNISFWPLCGVIPRRISEGGVESALDKRLTYLEKKYYQTDLSPVDSADNACRRSVFIAFLNAHWGKTTWEAFLSNRKAKCETFLRMKPLYVNKAPLDLIVRQVTEQDYEVYRRHFDQMQKEIEGLPLKALLRIVRSPAFVEWQNYLLNIRGDLKTLKRRLDEERSSIDEVLIEDSRMERELVADEQDSVLKGFDEFLMKQWESSNSTRIAAMAYSLEEELVKYAGEQIRLEMMDYESYMGKASENYAQEHQQRKFCGEKDLQRKLALPMSGADPHVGVLWGHPENNLYRALKSNPNFLNLSFHCLEKKADDRIAIVKLSEPMSLEDLLKANLLHETRVYDEEAE